MLLNKVSNAFDNYSLAFDIVEQRFINSTFPFDKLQASVNATKLFVSQLYAFDKIRERLNNYAQLLRQSKLIPTNYQN